MNSGNPFQDFSHISSRNSLKLLSELLVDFENLQSRLESFKGTLSDLETIGSGWLNEIVISDEKQDFLRELIKLGPEHLFYSPGRLAFAVSYYEKGLSNLLLWLIRSNETTNFTYNITDLNRNHLAWFVSAITRTECSEVIKYVNEIERNEELKQIIRNAVINSKLSHVSDQVARYGRRMGWYAAVRASKPAVVIETGVDKGLGSMVLAAALRRNSDEGFPGHLHAVDINPEAGFMVKQPYREYATIHYGDSLTFLQKFEDPIDMFIHDSNHAVEFERKEYQYVAEKLSPGSLILSDNTTIELPEFARKTGRLFLYFNEKPEEHFYPGAGIGAAFSSNLSSKGNDRMGGFSNGFRSVLQGKDEVGRGISEKAEIPNFSEFRAEHDFESVTKVNFRIQRFGDQDCGWNIIPDLLGKDSVIYCVGCGENISFDLALIKEFSCKIHAFDPTPKSLNYLHSLELPEEYLIHEVGLSNFDGRAKFNPPANLDHVSHTICDRAETADRAIIVSLKRLASIMEELGHDRIDLLKIDIEGAEYGVIEDLVKNKIPVGQLCVEFHHFLDGNKLETTLQGIIQLIQEGYVLHSVYMHTDYCFVLKSLINVSSK